MGGTNILNLDFRFKFRYCERTTKVKGEPTINSKILDLRQNASCGIFIFSSTYWIINTSVETDIKVMKDPVILYSSNIVIKVKMTVFMPLLDNYIYKRRTKNVMFTLTVSDIIWFCCICPCVWLTDWRSVYGGATRGRHYSNLPMFIGGAVSRCCSYILIFLWK